MVTFILKNPGGKDSTLIYMTYYFSGRRFKYSTGEKISPGKWNFEKQRARQTDSRSHLINSLLDRIAAEMPLIHLRLKAEAAPINQHILKSELNKVLNAVPGKSNFLSFVEDYIKTCKQKQTSKTIFTTTLKYLSAFPGSKDFRDINVNWLDRYVIYLQGKDFAANYIKKLISVTKQFLNEATDSGVNMNLEYKSRKFKPPSEDADVIYLTIAELYQIYRIVLPPGLGRCRDRFMIGAFTALRFSDFSRLTASHTDDGLIRIRQEKTGDPVVIPMHTIVKEILKKYDGELPPSISNQKMNEYLKVIGERSGLDQTVIKTITKGGIKVSTEYKKFQLITTHTARRSAATNMYLAGIPVLSIMKITGHKTEKAFLRYIRITSEENARLIASHPFFQTNIDGSKPGATESSAGNFPLPIKGLYPPGFWN